MTRQFSIQFFYLGGRRIRVFEARYKGCDAGHVEFRSTDSTVTFSTDRPLTNLEHLPDYRQVWVDEGAEIGDYWVDDDTGTQTVLAGFETVTVPGGIFPQCYKTATSAQPAFAESLRVHREGKDLEGEEFQRQIENSRLVIVRWFAPGVGLVKEEIGDSVTELVAVEAAGTGQPDSTITEEP